MGISKLSQKFELHCCHLTCHHQRPSLHTSSFSATPSHSHADTSCSSSHPQLHAPLSEFNPSLPLLDPLPASSLLIQQGMQLLKHLILPLTVFFKFWISLLKLLTKVVTRILKMPSKGMQLRLLSPLITKLMASEM